MAELVRELLHALGIELIPRRIRQFCLCLLAVVALAVPSALVAGAVMWSHDEQCALEHELVPALQNPALPRMAVVQGSKGCALVPQSAGEERNRK
jgi:hypothetical protein